MTKTKNHHVGIGLTSLFLSIPAPTLIHEYFNSVITNNSISLFQTSINGFEAQMLLILMITTSLGLFVTTIYLLGNYIIR